MTPMAGMPSADHFGSPFGMAAQAPFTAPSGGGKPAAKKQKKEAAPAAGGLAVPANKGVCACAVPPVSLAHAGQGDAVWCSTSAAMQRRCCGSHSMPRPAHFAHSHALWFALQVPTAGSGGKCRGTTPTHAHYGRLVRGQASIHAPIHPCAHPSMPPHIASHRMSSHATALLLPVLWAMRLRCMEHACMHASMERLWVRSASTAQQLVHY